MCLSCKSERKKIWSFVQNRMTGYPIKFDHNEVEELRRKFKKISGNRQVIDKQTFHQNMGILGLQSVFGFSDRLFNSFDIDSDGNISFQDFLEYMEVLKCGNQSNKAAISFKLIDIKNRRKVSEAQFKQFLADYFRSWTSITNSIITQQIKQRTDQYVQYIFKKVKRQTHKDTIDFKYYAEKMYCDREFMDAFEFITEGVANVLISDQFKQNDSMLLFKVLNKIKKIHLAFGTIDDLPNQRLSTFSNLMKLSPLKNRQSQMYDDFDQQPEIEQQYFPVNNISKTQPKQFFMRGQTRKGIFNKQSKRRDVQSPTRKFKNQQEFDCSTNTKQKSQYHHKCQSCYNITVLQKKLEFLANKLKQLIDETQTIYERLHEKFVDSVNAANHKKQTVDNIHQTVVPKDNMIFFGDDNWNLVLNMMIGIQMAVRSVKGYQEMLYEQPADFNLKYYFELVPRRFGGQKYISRICSFTDYAPNTFNHIRKIFEIDNEEYINSIGPNKLMASLMMGEVNSLTALTSQGKSGSFFYYTADGKYMLKTIQYRQYKHLRTILQDYYHYIKNNPDTLITKFFGLHKLIQKDDKGDVIGKSYFVIMGNVFNTKQRIIDRYDLKGSWYGRETKDPRPGITKKDNDFRQQMKNGILLDKEQRDKLVTIVKKDAQFFRRHDIIDYSLLIGVIRKQQDMLVQENQGLLNKQFRETKFYESNNKQEMYIVGIIDILTQYNSRKVMEYHFKKLIYGEGISAVPPDDYAIRFTSFIQTNVFKAKR